MLLQALLLAATAAAAPSTQTQEKRATTFCGQWDLLTVSPYTIYNNLWGQDSADSGSQCTTVDGISNSLLSWGAEWSWSGGPYNVKSYPNAVLEMDAVRVNEISEMDTRWAWSYSGSNLVANVAYDLFTASSCDTSTPEYEIMIWLSALGGAGPISSTGSPIATPYLAGKSWNLYMGAHSQMTVYSFVASDSSNLMSGDFSGDVKEFTDYLVNNQGWDSNQCLYSVGAGTEPFTGSGGSFWTSGYKFDVTTGGSGGGGTTTTTSTPEPTSGGDCAAQWGQCGGSGYTGPTCCSAGTCTYSNEWYSQCL